MNLKIGWEIDSNGDIVKVNKQGNKLYANSRASFEYFLIADDYLLTDTAIITIAHGENSYSYQMFYGEIVLENGDIKNGWYCISNGDELRVDLSTGTITATVSFNIKRFSTVYDNELVVDYTSATDTILIYPGSRYYPEAEASDVELIENDISLLQVTKLDKVFDNESGTVQTFANTSAGASITKTDGVDTTVLEVKADGVYINDLELDTDIDNKISAHNLDIASHPSLISEIENIKSGTTIVKKAEQDKNGIDIDTFYQKKTDNTLDTTSKIIVGAINELESTKQNTSTLMDEFQTRTDENLNTTSKNVVSAINANKSHIDLKVTSNVTNILTGFSPQIIDNNYQSGIILQNGITTSTLGSTDLYDSFTGLHIKKENISLPDEPYGTYLGYETNILKINNSKATINNSEIATDLTIASLFKNVSYNSTTGELTFTAFNDSTKVIDLPLELILNTSGSYYDNGVIYLKLANGEFLEIDVADLIDTYTAGDGITITDGVISLTEATKLDNLDLQSASVTDNVLTITKADDTTITFTDTNTTYENATSEVDGLMSADDKTRLDNIESLAEVNIIEDIKVNNVSLAVTEKAVNIDLSGYLTEHQDITGKEDKANKVTSITGESTDLEYPSAKCVYDLIGNISSTLDLINGEVE